MLMDTLLNQQQLTKQFDNMSFITNQNLHQEFLKPTQALPKTSIECQEADEQPMTQKKKLISKPQKTQPKTQGINIGEWTDTQNFLYASFLQANLEELQSQLKRRQTKIFVRMEKLICSRTADQCRSHHQKCMKKYGSAEQVVKSLLISKVVSEKNSIKSAGFLNSNFNQMNYDILPRNCFTVPLYLVNQKKQYDVQKTCNCDKAIGIKNIENYSTINMFPMMTQKMDDDKDLPKTGYFEQESVNQVQIPKVVYGETQNKFSINAQNSKNMIIEISDDEPEHQNTINKSNLVSQFGSKANDFEKKLLKNSGEEKIKIVLNVDGINKWNYES